MNSDLKNKYNLGGFTVSKLASSKAMQQGRSHIHPASQHSSQQNRSDLAGLAVVFFDRLVHNPCLCKLSKQQPVLRPSTHILSFWLAWMRCSI